MSVFASTENARCCELLFKPRPVQRGGDLFVDRVFRMRYTQAAPYLGLVMREIHTGRALPLSKKIPADRGLKPAVRFSPKKCVLPLGRCRFAVTFHGSRQLRSALVNVVQGLDENIRVAGSQGDHLALRADWRTWPISGRASRSGASPSADTAYSTRLEPGTLEPATRATPAPASARAPSRHGTPPWASAPG